jgi:hypothetical protein
MTFRGRYYARNGKLYEIVKELEDGRYMGAEVLDENASFGEPEALGKVLVYWDEKGDHPSDRAFDLVEAIREGKKIGR